MTPSRQDRHPPQRCVERWSLPHHAEHALPAKPWSKCARSMTRTSAFSAG